jgi:hypothetical protein
VPESVSMVENDWPQPLAPWKKPTTPL